MTHLLADLRLAARSLARAPLFTLVAVVSIALGIGANTAVFTLLDQVALRPLPVERPDELVQIHARGEENYGGATGNGTELSWPMFRDFQDKAAGFAGVVGRVSTSMHVGHEGIAASAPRATWCRATSSRCSACRRRWAACSRPPTTARRARIRLRCSATTTGAVASSAGPTSIGRSITINGQPFTVIGVAPRGFYGLELGTASDVYVPLTMQPQLGPAWLKMPDRRFRWVQVYARLQPGMTPERAEAGLQPLFSAIRQNEAGEPELRQRIAGDEEAVPRLAHPRRRRPPRPGPAAGAAGAVVDDPHGRRRRRAADRLRQRRQPADRPWRRS